MNNESIKNLNETLRTLTADIRRCRAADQILRGYVRLDSSNDGIATALGEMQAAADELLRHARAYQKAIADATASVNQEDVHHVKN